MTTLKTLADAREEILKAEVAALLHNLGKCSSAFIGQMTGTPAGYADFSYQYIVGFVADWFQANSSRLSESERQRVREVATKAAQPVTYEFLNYEIKGQNVRDWFHIPRIRLPAPLNDREYTFGELVEFHKGWHKPGKSTPPRIVIVYGSEPRVTALLHAAHDAASGGEKQQALHLSQQTWGLTQASAFGHEHEINPVDLDRERIRLIEAVLKEQPDRQQILKTSLHIALGDTQRPINEVSLWDLSASTAALFKAALVEVILDGWKPWPDVRWRLLHVSFNGPAFWGQAHHVTDLLGRRQALQDGLDAIRDILEVQYPLGNEVYRDEHGSVFVVPNVDHLLKLEDEEGTSLKRLLEKAFDTRGIRGELVPEVKVSEPYEGKEIKLAQVLKGRSRKNIPQPDVAAGWWAEGQRPANAEICTVCGQRPVGYPVKGSPHEQDLELDPWANQGKAEDRNVCRVCLQRRGRRARDWARNKKTAGEKLGPFERTIWTDEVADDNGRFALVVGRFALDGWLDGTLIPTMLKSASFARIRRCWDTTRQFWLEVQDEELPKCVGRRLRLGLRPVNVKAINHSDPKKGLGRWHTYEADVGGRRLGLCWNPNDPDDKETTTATDHDLFWTTDNLRYLGRQLSFEQKVLKTDDDLAAEWLRWLDGHTLPLYEPGGYLGQERRANVDAQGCRVVKQEHFHPFVPLMIEPATFMTLVPADKALVVAQAIKDKYDTEMARVHDRLPLHLGLVFAPRRTPLAAVLEAGRAMLDRGEGPGAGGWEAWGVAEKPREKIADEAPHYLTKDNQHFEKWWDIPLKRGGQEIHLRIGAVMGDGETEDQWYVHLLTRKPKAEGEDFADRPWKRPSDLEEGDEIYIAPSTFDFKFLDTTARRFEIAYQTSEVSETSEVSRLSRPTRPFLLDDLGRLETLWTELRYLEKSQRHQVIAIIEATREAWFGADREGQSPTDGVFRQFVRDTLAGAAWPERHKWKDICQAEIDGQLVAAGLAGELADLAELHMEILKE